MSSNLQEAVKGDLTMSKRTGLPAQRNQSQSPVAHRGNKAGLPQKPCMQCGLPMTWRKRWARNWEAVRYCSERCRAEARRAGAAGGGS